MPTLVIVSIGRTAIKDYKIMATSVRYIICLLNQTQSDEGRAVVVTVDSVGAKTFTELAFRQPPGRRGLRLNFGCGQDIRPDFLNVDLSEPKADNCIQWDLTKGLPAWIDNIEYVYSSHFIEHISNEANARLMADCFQRMVPGGVFRYAVPNFRAAFTDYVKNNWEPYDLLPLDQVAPNGLFIELLEYAVYGEEHVALWDGPKVLLYLDNAGFKNARIDSYKEGVDIADELRTRYSFYVEAVKGS
jgi:predicted SAM-dependent methyltransferase